MVLHSHHLADFQRTFCNLLIIPKGFQESMLAMIIFEFWINLCVYLQPLFLQNVLIFFSKPNEHIYSKFIFLFTGYIYWQKCTFNIRYFKAQVNPSYLLFNFTKVIFLRHIFTFIWPRVMGTFYNSACKSVHSLPKH